MLPSLGSATCTDATRKCCHCTQNQGIPCGPFHDAFHGAGLGAARRMYGLTPGVVVVAVLDYLLLVVEAQHRRCREPQFPALFRPSGLPFGRRPAPETIGWKTRWGRTSFADQDIRCYVLATRNISTTGFRT
jgi:hypothetical protein